MELRVDLGVRPGDADARPEHQSQEPDAQVGVHPGAGSMHVDLDLWTLHGCDLNYGPEMGTKGKEWKRMGDKRLKAVMYN